MTKTPLWRGIADDLRADIANGRWIPGDKLPTEAQLAARFGVNRHTIRHALSHLIENGWIISRRGAGTFVQSAPLDYPLGDRVRFHQIIDAAGRLPSRQVLSIEERKSTAAEAAQLSVSDGAPVIVVHGLASADGVPIALSESLYPSERLPGLVAALEKNTRVTAALKAIGVSDYVRRSTRISASLATVAQATSLRVVEGAPLLVTEAVSVDLQDRPVELGRTHFAGERISLLTQSAPERES